ncbi:MAG: 1-acyl-sn-glycerol-3-phosphate acyltransferase [Alphaproteobacteria bacterium]|nr:1-acyl-sn-glycerol-3-phosphate acyltransferase [Alphaproteobacteria bacterium]
MKPPLSKRLFYRACWMVVGAISFTVFRMRARGWSKVPKDGPLLLLGNHSSALDPVWAGFPIVRQAHFMASEALFRIRGLGWLIGMLGAFPKQKFVRDHSSMKTLFKLYRSDQVVVMFPEGTRTWDGRVQPTRKGIGRLIKKMNARVVFAKNHTGFLFHPRWAKYPRFVPVVVEYSEPETFDGLDEDQIWERVMQGITIDPDEVRAVGLSFGWRMAHGLPAYLWACPACHAVAGLEVHPRDGNSVRCRECGAEWKVTVDSRLRAKDGQEITVARAFDKIDERFGLKPILDAEHHAQTGVVLRCPRGRLLRLHKGRESELLHEGELRLTETDFAVLGPEGEVLWEVKLEDLRAVSVEIGNKLRLLPPDDVLRLEPEGQSPLMWSHFIRHWRHVARGEEGKPLPG